MDHLLVQHGGGGTRNLVGDAPADEAGGAPRWFQYKPYVKLLSTPAWFPYLRFSALVERARDWEHK